MATNQLSGFYLWKTFEVIIIRNY